MVDAGEREQSFIQLNSNKVGLSTDGICCDVAGGPTPSCWWVWWVWETCSKVRLKAGLAGVELHGYR